MNNLTVFQGKDVLRRSDPNFARRLKLFTMSAGRGLVGPEIDQAIEMCNALQANPFLAPPDIYFFVFDANDANKRRVVPVLSIMMYRKRADRTGNYRPDERAPRFTYDPAIAGPDNPKGIVSCEMSVFKHSHGAWFPATESLPWSERAPIRTGGSEGEEWEPTGQTYPKGHAKEGKPKYRKVIRGEQVKVLDPTKPNWHNMPETMLAKCVEAAVLRKAFPDDLGGTYAEGELDLEDSRVLDLEATEILAEEAKKDRLDRVGASGITLTFDWLDGKSIEPVPLGRVHDRAMAWIDANPAEAAAWAERNRETLRQFWGHSKDATVAIRKKIDQITKGAKP